MAAPNILIQLDTDPLPSSFDAVVAVDAGVSTLLPYGDVRPDNVTSLVHGAMFTRGGETLRHTAIFIGGSKVPPSEAVLSKVLQTFFGPVRVSVMFDANGCNTTAAAAVLSAMRHVDLAGATATVLGGTGPVGMRVGRLLAGTGCQVRLGSRDVQRAENAIERLGAGVDRTRVSAVSTADATATANALEGAEVVIACGAAGAQLMDQGTLQRANTIRVAIDLNAVPPSGIEGIAVSDRGREADGRFLYGAIGVGGLKMKIHKAAVAELFTANDRVLDAEEIFALGQRLVAEG